ncbi:MAG: tyrosine--tRNA ligase [Candidatus Beckwithbacteria bacterium]|nr:tyrosine--tRNA ligase [Candidatus Beckwithbacteria bacterium]
MPITIDQVLARGVEQILPSKEGLKKLMQTKKIKLYLGIDPTATNLHLGHTVMLRKLQQFADLGHEAILLFGTGTVLVGDPSQRGTARKLITQTEIDQNIKTWKDQVKPIIDFNKVKIKYNGDWLLKMNLKDIIEIASKISAVQLFKREMFQRRLKLGDTVWYHETMYPLLQGYDSVVMDVDLELGGTDQIFNMLVGRELQQKINHREKFVLAGKMILGTDGQQMNKTSGNCIWLTDTAEDMFAKLMAVRDELMPDYWEFFTDKTMPKNDPLTVKKTLALEITSQYHGLNNAKVAQKHFEQTFQQKAPEYKETIKFKENLIKTLAQITASNAEAKRLIIQGAVDINNLKTTDLYAPLKIGDRLKIGQKTFVKVV